jgi:hypothetical protein
MVKLVWGRLMSSHTTANIRSFSLPHHSNLHVYNKMTDDTIISLVALAWHFAGSAPSVVTAWVSWKQLQAGKDAEERLEALKVSVREFRAEKSTAASARPQARPPVELRSDGTLPVTSRGSVKFEYTAVSGLHSP